VVEKPAPTVPKVTGALRARGLTKPTEFNFATSRRTRAVIPSLDDLVLPKQKPVSKTGAAKLLTVPKAFNLSKSNRPKPQAEVPVEARPKPKQIKKIEAVPVPVRKRALTIPVTPRVATRKRKTPQKAVDELAPAKIHVKQSPDQTTSAVSAPHPVNQPSEEHIENPRVFAKNGVAVVEPPPLTVFEPFNLQSEALALAAKQKLEERILHEHALEDEMRKFKANPPLTLTRPPFRPLASNRSLTVPGTPDLKSTARALNRAEFSVEKNQRISIKKDREAQEKALEEANEREEIRKLRKALEFKATPFVNPSPMRLAPATRSLTVPESPQLRTNFRGMR
jgi:hypothetical protein